MEKLELFDWRSMTTLVPKEVGILRQSERSGGKSTSRTWKPNRGSNLQSRRNSWLEHIIWGSGFRRCMLNAMRHLPQSASIEDTRRQSLTGFSIPAITRSNVNSTFSRIEAGLIWQRTDVKVWEHIHQRTELDGTRWNVKMQPNTMFPNHTESSYDSDNMNKSIFIICISSVTSQVIISFLQLDWWSINKWFVDISPDIFFGLFRASSCWRWRKRIAFPKKLKVQKMCKLTNENLTYVNKHGILITSKHVLHLLTIYCETSGWKLMLLV